jgi:uncharacterized repeat protein (TIGR03803 family)
MKAFVIALQSLGVCALVAATTGCGGKGLAPFSSAAPSGSEAGATSYKVLYSFRGRDGAAPLASLINVDGTLYGTTSLGGAHNVGTVFSITPTGKERVLYSFRESGPAGNYPGAALIDVNGTLYGTTELGAKNTGTVFSITTSGKMHVLHGFGSGAPSGMQPSASLIAVKGTLYGTTSFGGYGNFGTVFSISMIGEEATLHIFGRKLDGQIPAANLIETNGVLYSTTFKGGKYGRGNSCSGSPCPGDGTVFSISTAGKERVLHSFGNGSDGLNSQAALINIEGTLYGTTDLGGTHNAGTIFSIDTAGTEKVLYSFKGGGSDGAIPEAPLIEVNGTLYGTTLGAGTDGPYGTVFSINKNGSAEQVLHSFGASKDGRAPTAALLDVNGTLYGTTSSGGAYGRGTIFALTP